MTVIIIEDEAAAAAELKMMLGNIDPAIEVLAVLDSVITALNWFRTHPMPDLIFSDIYLLDGTSFDIFRELKSYAPVIFCTAYNQHALEAFRSNGIDYLLKPLTAESLEASFSKLNRVKKSFFGRQPSIPSLKKILEELLPKYRSSLMVYERDKIIAVDLNMIHFLVSEKSKCLAVTDQMSYPFEGTLDLLMPTLDPRVFFRANRQYIIHHKAVKNIEILPLRKLAVNLTGCKEAVVISKEKKKSFIQWMEGLEDPLLCP